ncbi:hypothetical protein MKX03_025213 [Papaver bracteatum]|nr:hypothetical protein MKX03_025213 [Papaver bracteatum]
MYATRPLSLYREDPNELSWLPPAETHGSSSYLFITDDEEESIVKDVKGGFLFPCSQAITCSREEDMGTCFCSNYIKDTKPKALNHRNIYQTVEIHEPKHGGFSAKPVVPNGILPGFLRDSQGWNVYKSDSKLCQLTNAPCLNFSMCSVLPELNIPLHNNQNSSPLVVLPCCFWEAIYTCENDYYSSNNVVAVSTSVKKETVKLFGMEATMDNIDHDWTDGIKWIRNDENNVLGLSIAIVEKIKWIQENGGFIGGDGEKDTRVEHVEEFKLLRNHAGWERFGCFVLVERFVLKTLSGAVVFTCDYKTCPSASVQMGMKQLHLCKNLNVLMYICLCVLKPYYLVNL